MQQKAMVDTVEAALALAEKFTAPTVLRTCRHRSEWVGNLYVQLVDPETYLSFGEYPIDVAAIEDVPEALYGSLQGKVATVAKPAATDR